MRTAVDIVLPKPSGSVRSLGGRRFALDYKVAGAGPNVAVDVFERGRGAQHVIGTLKGGHGVLRFTAASGPGGRRDIVAVPHGLNAPATDKKVIAHYIAPKPARTPAPRHVALARGHNKARVAWRKSRGAARYVVRATLRDGRRQELPGIAAPRFVTFYD